MRHLQAITEIVPGNVLIRPLIGAVELSQVISFAMQLTPGKRNQILRTVNIVKIVAQRNVVKLAREQAFKLFERLLRNTPHPEWDSALPCILHQDLHSLPAIADSLGNYISMQILTETGKQKITIPADAAAVRPTPNIHRTESALAAESA